MPISTYTELKAAVLDFSHRGDMSARVENFIALCESDMQVRCKLQEFEASGAVSITAGVGTLPTGFSSMRSVYWDGNLDKPLKYITPDLLDQKRNSSGTGVYYTISAGQILVAPASDGTVVMRYSARFTALSGTNATNTLLTNYPDAYLHGTLMQLHAFANDDKAAQKAAVLYEAAIERIKTDNRDKKYAGVALEVRPR